MVVNASSEVDGGAAVAACDGDDAPVEGPCKQVVSEPPRVSSNCRGFAESNVVINDVALARGSNDAHAVSEPACTTSVPMPLLPNMALGGVNARARTRVNQWRRINSGERSRSQHLVVSASVLALHRSKQGARGT